MNCSPKKEKTNKQSCFDKKQLLKLAKVYNRSNDIICNLNSKKCIKKTGNIDINSLDLYKELVIKLSPLCEDEHCWLSLDIINQIKDTKLKDTLLHFTFKPVGPKGINKWLTTSDINNIMLQYSQLYKNTFNFLGVHPSDFNKINKFNWNTIKAYKKYMGIVLNTDTHNKSGQHWLSIFIDNKNLIIDYFDSLGNLPNKHIKDFLKNFKLYKINFNKIVHQKAGSQCGIYSCFFLIKRLEGYTLNQINEGIKADGDADKKMKEERKKLFYNS